MILSPIIKMPAKLRRIFLDDLHVEEYLFYVMNVRRSEQVLHRQSFDFATVAALLILLGIAPGKAIAGVFL